MNLNNTVSELADELRDKSIFAFRIGKVREKNAAKDTKQPYKVILLSDAIKLFKTTFAEKCGAITRIQAILKQEWSKSASDYIAITQENIRLKSQVKEMSHQLKRKGINKNDNLNGMFFKKKSTGEKKRESKVATKKESNVGLGLLDKQTTKAAPAGDSVLDLIKSVR